MPADKNMRILIVDDHQSMRRMLADILKAVGFRNVAYADDGDKAWKKLGEDEFEFVMLDWNMPRMSGLDLLKKMRGSEDLKGIPVLMVTAESEQGRVVEAIQTGVNSYVVKPYTANIIYKKVNEIFGPGSC